MNLNMEVEAKSNIMDLWEGSISLETQERPSEFAILSINESDIEFFAGNRDIAFSGTHDAREPTPLVPNTNDPQSHHLFPL